jgi:hypothetical protein
VQIDSLRELLALYPQPRRARAIQRQLPLLDRAQIDLADLELDLREIQGSLIVLDVLDQDRIAIPQCDFGRQRILDIAEGALRCSRILGDRLLLLGRANLDWRAQRPALIQRRDQIGAQAPHRIAVVLEHEQLA